MGRKDLESSIAFEAEPLVHQCEKSHDDFELYAGSGTSRLWSGWKNRMRDFLALLLFCSVLLNLILFVRVNDLRRSVGLCESEYTGLGYNATSPYHVYTDFINDNHSIADPLWEAMDSSPIMVALDEEYIQAHDLKPSIPFPWDQSKGLYHIKAFHHIHCLKNVRRAYFDALEASPTSKPLIPPAHIAHCLDTIRQDLMCNADDTPMPTINERHKIGDGQVRKCKDWDALVRWTQAPERQSCFKMIDEYRRVPNSLEEFAYCPEGSEHTEAMQGYFEKWGHKNPFGDDDQSETR